MGGEMTHEESMAMAREVGLLPDNSHPTPETRAMRKRCEVVKRFAALVAAKEREACALVCDASVEEWLRLDGSHHELTEAQMLADEIRARGQKDAA